MKDLAENLLHPARAKLGHRGVDGTPATERRMRSRQEAAGVLAVVPHILGVRNHSRDALRSFAFGRAQPVAPALECGFRHDAVHEPLLLDYAGEDPARGLS